MAKVNCPECNGKGEVPCNMNYGGMQHPDNCPVCGGESAASVCCPECHGNGKVDD